MTVGQGPCAGAVCVVSYIGIMFNFVFSVVVINIWIKFSLLQCHAGYFCFCQALLVGNHVSETIPCFVNVFTFVNH
jgi:hypothetical protein